MAEQQTERARLRRWKPTLRNLLSAVVTVVIVGVALWLWLKWDPQAFAEWKREAPPVLFFTALALLPAIGFPTTPFFVLAGATFSPWENVVGITASLAVNVMLCYWVANSWLRRVVVWALHRSGRELPSPGRRSALRVALLIKMAPGVPTFLKNYAIGMSGVSFAMHFAICFGITACYAAAFVLLGDSLVDRDYSSGALAVGLLLAVACLLYLIRLVLRRRAADSTPP